MSRRSLTPTIGSLQGFLAQRRAEGGPRIDISAHVTLRAGAREYDGWALNLSRGGIRVVIEGHVQLGQEFDVEGHNPDEPGAPPRPVRVVWVQDERDGSVLGLAFTDVEGSVPPAPDVEPSLDDQNVEPSSDRGESDPSE